MSTSLQLEGRQFEWRDVLAAYHREKAPEGIVFLLRSPPYVGFVGVRDSRYPGLLTFLKSKGLLFSPVKANLLFERFMNQLLDEALVSSFEEPEAARRILERIAMMGKPFHPRLALACVELSGGDLAALQRWCDEALTDYRDVYWAAWYR